MTEKQPLARTIYTASSTSRQLQIHASQALSSGLSPIASATNPTPTVASNLLRWTSRSRTPLILTESLTDRSMSVRWLVVRINRCRGRSHWIFPSDASMRMSEGACRTPYVREGKKSSVSVDDSSSAERLSVEGRVKRSSYEAVRESYVDEMGTPARAIGYGL